MDITIGAFNAQKQAILELLFSNGIFEILAQTLVL